MSQTTNYGWQKPLSREQNLELFLAAKLDEIDAALGNTAGAALAYTPTVTPGSGTFTSVSATLRYWQWQKRVFFHMDITDTTNGTAGTNVQATLPVTPLATINQPVAAVEVGVTGKGLSAYVNGATGKVVIRNYDTTYPGANGYVLSVHGWYEAA